MMVRRKPQATDVARFSGPWWIKGVRSLFWIVLVTVLIWIYADMEFTDTAEVIATLKLNTGESRQIVLLSKKDFSLKFEIAGSRSSLEEFQRELSGKGSALNYDISRDYPAGKHFITAMQLLEKVAHLKEKGITVKSVQPAAIEIRLDTIMKIEDVPVELKATGATLKPPVAQKISISVPTSQWQLILEKLKGNPPELTTLPVNLSHLQPGTTSNISAAVLPMIEGINITPVPETVAFEVKIISSSVTETIPIAVQVLTPAVWAEASDTTWQEYVLVRQASADWRARLKIEGQKKNLKPENICAYIQLTDEDKKPISWVEREVIVCFPPGMSLKLISPQPKLKFRLEKRKTTPTVP